MLAFSGRHAEQSVWVLTQKYKSVQKDLREQTRWVCLFHCKDRDSFEDCLPENDVIPSREQRALVWQQLAETKHAKLLLKTDQSVCYTVLAMLSNNEVTEGLLIDVLGENFVLLFFIAWHVATARLYFRQVHRNSDN